MLKLQMILKKMDEKQTAIFRKTKELTDTIPVGRSIIPNYMGQRNFRAILFYGITDGHEAYERCDGAEMQVCYDLGWVMRKRSKIWVVKRGGLRKLGFINKMSALPFQSIFVDPNQPLL